VYRGRNVLNDPIIIYYEGVNPVYKFPFVYYLKRISLGERKNTKEKNKRMVDLSWYST